MQLGASAAVTDLDPRCSALGSLLFLRESRNGYKTFTTFITCTMLVVVVLYQCLTASYTGLRHKLAYSAIVFEPVSYNSIQPHNIKGQ